MSDKSFVSMELGRQSSDDDDDDSLLLLLFLTSSNGMSSSTKSRRVVIPASDKSLGVELDTEKPGVSHVVIRSLLSLSFLLPPPNYLSTRSETFEILLASSFRQVGMYSIRIVRPMSTNLPPLFIHKSM